MSEGVGGDALTLRLHGLRLPLRRDIERLRDLRVNHALSVNEADLINPLGGLAIRQLIPDGLYLRGLDAEFRVERPAPRSLKTYRRGLVPDDIAAAQNLNEHNHVNRVDSAVH